MRLNVNSTLYAISRRVEVTGLEDTNGNGTKPYTTKTTQQIKSLVYKN